MSGGTLLLILLIIFYRVNIEILGTLLRHGTVSSNFGYVVYIMNIVKKENINLNDIFLKHLVTFNDKCSDIVNKKVCY